jgi:lysophospholipase L1-like esterase
MKKGFILLICILFALHCGAQTKKSIYIVYIGNSITQSGHLAPSEVPPVQTNLYLSTQKDIDLRGFSNQGKSGKTTVDFLPAQQTCFPNVVAAATPFAEDSQALLIFSIMLGTNDSAISGPNGAPISAAQYYTNLKAIIDELLLLYPKAIFVLHRPLWYSPNAHNRAQYLQAGLKRVESYALELDKIVQTYTKTKPNQVFSGDSEAFDFFKANYATDYGAEDGKAGTFYLHPNARGAAHLGEFWGKAIYKAIKCKM